jgi:transposase
MLEMEQEMGDSLTLKVKHLYEVERLSGRQIARQLGLSRKTVTALLRAQKASRPPRSFLLKPCERLIEECKYPSLKAIQVWERLKTYDFKGSYTTVKLYTRRYRKKRPAAFHELEFLPGEDYGKKEIMLI